MERLFIYFKDPPIVVLVLVNLLPLYGVFFLDWDAFWIVLLYWTENIILGFYNILRMALVNVKYPAANIGKFFMIPFFAFHYGAFCAGHGLFILALFKKDVGRLFGNESWPFLLVFVELFVNVIKKVADLISPEMYYAILSLFISHGFSFVYNFFIKDERNNTDMKKLMSAPYTRIVILHIAIIAGAFPVMILGSPAYLLVVLVFLKIIIDIYLHFKEHKKLRLSGK